MDQIDSSCRKSLSFLGRDGLKGICGIHSTIAKLELLKHQFEQLQNILGPLRKFYGCRIILDEENLKFVEDLKARVNSLETEEEALLRIEKVTDQIIKDAPKNSTQQRRQFQQKYEWIINMLSDRLSEAFKIFDKVFLSDFEHMYTKGHLCD